MNYDTTQTKENPRAGRVFMALIALGCAMGAAPGAPAQSLAAPTTPPLIAAPAGNSLFLAAQATGTQGYVCLPTSTGAPTASWTVKGSRPQATLFQRFFGQEFQIATHFLSPDTNPNGAAPSPLPFGSATWQSSLDSSTVWAQVLHATTIPAGSDPSCPHTGAIPCLLLESIGSQAGPSGGAMLARTTFIQRLNTRGGSAPADGCSTAADVGSQTLVPYSADYYFYRKDK